jgi:hypothetical protein
MHEQRQVRRNKTYLGGEIGFNRQIPTTRCVIRNMSTRGALLQLDNVSSIPPIFEISIPSKGQSYRAKMLWQQLGRAGLAFENAKEESREAAVPSRANELSDKDRLQQRIDAILNR